MTKKKKMTIVSAVASTAILAAVIVGAAATALVGCTRVENDKDIDRAWTCHGNDCYTKAVDVDGHTYIIMDGFYSGGIIHAASCWCMKK